MSFCIDDKNLLQKYKAIWNMIESLKNIYQSMMPDIEKPK